MTPANLDLTIYRGIVFDPVNIVVKDNTGNPVNLTAWSVFAKMRNGLGQILDLQPVISNATQGTITLNFTSSETEEFISGENPWDLTLQRPTGDKIGPYVSGVITVKDTAS